MSDASRPTIDRALATSVRGRGGGNSGGCASDSADMADVVDVLEMAMASPHRVSRRKKR